MKLRRHRIEESWHDHNGGLSLYLTRHDEGAGPVYRVENWFTDQISWNTESEAKKTAADRLAAEGHRCTDCCYDWRTVLA